MTPIKANLLNAVCLIIMGLWGYVEVSSPTALIPVIFGLLLFLCSVIISKKPHLNKLVSHIAVTLTLLILVALAGMRLPKSIDAGGIGLIRVIFMIATSGISIITFVKSFIDVRKKQQ